MARMRNSVLWMFVVFLLATNLLADEQIATSSLVRIRYTKDGKSEILLGEVGRRNDTHIEVFDLKTGQPSIFKISDLLSFTEPVSDISAIATVGVPNFLAWKIKQSTAGKPDGVIIALFPLVDVDGNEVEEGKNLIQEWTTGLVSRGVTVVDREHLEKVLQELNLQQTKEFDPKKAQEIGKQIGATTILTGTVVVSRAGYGTAQLRLIRVDTGEITTAVAYRMGKLKSQIASGTSNRGLPGKVSQYSFTDEKEIKKDWNISNNWRIENGTFKIRGTVLSKRVFKGDFVMKIFCQGTPSSYCSIDMWGESFGVGIRQPVNVVVFARKGDTCVIGSSTGAMKEIKLKEGHAEESHVLIRMGPPPGFSSHDYIGITAIAISGTEVEDKMNLLTEEK